jgi:hypothetical protein
MKSHENIPLTVATMLRAGGAATLLRAIWTFEPHYNDRRVGEFFPTGPTSAIIE